MVWIDDEAFLAVMAGLDPATGERLGRRFGEDSVRGFDATFSAPKSVSVLFAVGNEQLQRAGDGGARHRGRRGVGLGRVAGAYEVAAAGSCGVCRR